MNWVFLIPITAIVMGIGIGMLGLWTEHKRKSQMLEQTHKERMAAIERGITLPSMNPETNAALSGGKSTPPNPGKVLRFGVFMLSLGIVLYFALEAAGAAEAAVFGLVPATLGLANLAYAAVLFSNERKAGEEKSRPRLPDL